MAMNTGETQALNGLMRWVLDLPRETGPVTSDDARSEAMWLMDRARKVLGAGLGADDVAEHWPPDSGDVLAAGRVVRRAGYTLVKTGAYFDLRERHARLQEQLAFIVQAIDAWQDGADPGDTLRAIRDQLAGKTPEADGD